MFDAVILAGGNAKGLDDVEAKGLVRINDRPMLEYVIDALLACEDIGTISVVMPIEYDLERANDTRMKLVVFSGSLPRVMKAGVDALPGSNKVLILSADVPLLTAESIEDFLKRCEERDAGFYYPVVREGEAEKRFPDVKRTYAKVKDGCFTGGNIVLMDPVLINKNMDIIEKVYENRKKPVKIAQVFGYMFLFKFILGRLTIKQVEERVGKVINSRCAGIITPYIEIGIDVDKQSDLELVKQVITGGAA